MAAMELDKGWLTGAAGAYVLLNTIAALRVAPAAQAADGFEVDALIQGNWVTIAQFPSAQEATVRLQAVLKEMKNLFRYNS